MELIINPSSPPRCCPWDIFRSFKVCSYAKERVECGKQRQAHYTYTISGKTAALVYEFEVEGLPSAEVQTCFLRLQRRTWPWAEHSDDDTRMNIIYRI